VCGERGAFYLAECATEEALRLHGGADTPESPGAGPFPIREGDAVAAVERPVFFDLETTGFWSTPLFLSATLSLDPGGGVARQRFARNYAEEAAVVEATIEELAGAGAVISFNGKSYDMPFLRNRAAFHRIPFRAPALHLDLLHLCRRAWKGRFPDFRLQTLETLFTGGDRDADIPSGDIPALYHDYVRRGFDPRMPHVFRHNLRDVVTLVRLFLRLVEEESSRRNGS